MKNFLDNMYSIFREILIKLLPSYEEYEVVHVNTHANDEGRIFYTLVQMKENSFTGLKTFKTIDIDFLNGTNPETIMKKIMEIEKNKFRTKDRYE